MTAVDDGLDVLRAEALEEQRRAIAVDTRPGEPVYLEACPGAGKTRVIVERHLTRPLSPRTGRAVVSFTRVAGAEIRRRCEAAERPDLVGPPHFVGTLDTFIWRHLVRPHLPRPATDGRTWKRLESWWEHPAARNGAVTLDDFRFDLDGWTGLHIGRAHLVKSLGAGEGGPSQGVLEAWASSTLLELYGQGYITGDLLRDMALKNLETAGTGERIADLLTARFGELIVDEAQDCSAPDEGILARLAAAGLPMLLVRDPDQAIYAFREARWPDRGTRATRGALPPGDTVRLTSNWRSSQVVCDLAATLRTGGRAPDSAVGAACGAAAPVLLIEVGRGRKQDAVAAFAEKAERLGIVPGERAILAYNRRTLPSGQVGAGPLPKGRAVLARLAWATAVLRAPSAPKRQCAQAWTVLEEAVLEYWLGGCGLPVSEAAEGQGVDGGALRRSAARVLAALPPLTVTAQEWKSGALTAFNRNPPADGLSAPHVPTWRCPSPKSGPIWEVADLPGAQYVTGAVARVCSVHDMKGEEADAVLVFVPQRRSPAGDGPARTHIVDMWTSAPSPGNPRTLSPDDAETLRVYYVAVTRARRLLALALPPRELGRMRTFLEARGIPVVSNVAEGEEQLAMRFP
ncbi:UvrD-helicase domain-containing protein [Nocardiopsis baichengensis]|uniref:UvrD-helicase domain-containing protein n=1 Tax=Nocardiopsis baichengensis TaxID=280240 RepID=UPI00034DDEC2|nr:UvrD-helicase domain-containing protein [Nocardiopsis baichengensis]